MHTPPTIQKVCTTCYKKGITFSKSTAMKFIGSRTKLERLVAEGRIRMDKASDSQNGKWRCNAGDVLFYSK